MSDDEGDFMMEDDGEDYGFEYEEDDSEEPDVDLENSYYNAKALKEDDTKAALNGFQKVVELEKEKGDWGFKAYKQMVKLTFKLNQLDKTLNHYNAMLEYTKNVITRNYAEKSINSILDFVSSATEMGFLEGFYQATLAALEEAKNERLSFKTNLKLAKLWLDREEYPRLSKILRHLHKSCQREDGSDDLKKGTQLLEIYALEIQMYTATKDHKKLKELYQQSLHIKSAIPHPKIMGIIRECGGKMHMAEGDYNKAQSDFYEAFKNYDEAGSPARMQCLKYLVLASILMRSETNLFDAQEIKPYKNDKEIIVMMDLTSAYFRHDISDFERILRANRKVVMDDPFIRDHVEDLLTIMRTHVLYNSILSYTSVTLEHVAKELNIEVAEVEDLVVQKILEGKINGKIDQLNGRLVLNVSSDQVGRYAAMDRWIRSVETLTKNVINRV